MRRFGIVLLGLVVALGMVVSAPPTKTVQAAGPSGGVVLDGFGGLHPFGGVSINTANAPYWNGWNIVRSLAMKADGSGGWELDGFGGVHAFGSAAPIWAGPYWNGWDIARAITMLPNGTQGYLLDGFGGIHALNGAPPLFGWPYWNGWDIARGLDIHTDASGNPDGGWMLDGYGGLHPFGNAPPFSNSHYTNGFDVYKKIHIVNGGGYALARNGIIETVNSPAGVNWAGYPSWGSWDIVSDVVPLNAILPATGGPTPDRAQLGAAMDYFHAVDRVQRGRAWIWHADNLASVAGNGATFNVGACGGGGVISDRSQDMYARNYFAHPIPGCSGTQYVFSTYERGWGYRAAGENIAWIGGYNDPLDTVMKVNTMWLNSAEHYANMMNPSFSSVGCGTVSIANGSYQGYNGPISIWTCEFMG